MPHTNEEYDALIEKMELKLAEIMQKAYCYGVQEMADGFSIALQMVKEEHEAVG